MQGTFDFHEFEKRTVIARASSLKAIEDLGECLALDFARELGTHVSCNNLLRALLTVLIDCEADLMAQARNAKLRRPHNGNAEGLCDFEMELAKMIAVAAGRSKLAQ